MGDCALLQQSLKTMAPAAMAKGVGDGCLCSPATVTASLEMGERGLLQQGLGEMEDAVLGWDGRIAKSAQGGGAS